MSVSTINTEANQFVPHGTYLDSSDDITITVAARCHNGQAGAASQHLNSEVSYSSTDAPGIVDICNTWGTLEIVKDSAAAGTVVEKFGPLVPAGSYQATCEDVTVTVKATCKNADGDDVSSAPVQIVAEKAATYTDLKNVDGVLTLLS